MYLIIEFPHSRLVLLVALLCLFAGCNSKKDAADSSRSEVSAGSKSSNGQGGRKSVSDKVRTLKPNRSLSMRLGTRFIPPPGIVYRAPNLQEIEIPVFDGANAIWGATGIDDQGRIYFGVASHGVEVPSARLFRYDPSVGRMSDLGNVVEKLKQLKVHSNGESQMKIHTKIVQADDGQIYFASMDETDESGTRMIPPKWGSHLWRVDPETARWTHLAKLDKAVVTMAGTGRYLYMLGYFGHELFRYDTMTSAMTRITVGSWGAHISRNILADLYGHAYVPRIVNTESGAPTCELVEFDPDLQEIVSHPLTEYRVDRTFNTHGIVGFTWLPSEELIFSSDTGFLWKLTPSAEGPSICEELGFFHPDGESYAASLTTFDKGRYVCGLCRRNKRYVWCVYDLERRRGAEIPFSVSNQGLLEKDRMHLYGTHTRDSSGNAYIVGRLREFGGVRPVVIQASFAP